MNDHADLASVARDARLPLRVGEVSCQRLESARALFEALGQSVRSSAV
jgi:hypothetical protein